MSGFGHLDVDELRQLLHRARAEEWGNVDVIAAELATREADAGPAAATKPPPHRKMSVPERAMDAILKRQLRAGEIADYAYEEVRVRVGMERCWLLVDFVVWHTDGSVQMIETKGRRHWDDARVKFMAAVKQYPGWRWTWLGWDAKAKAFTAKHDYPAQEAAA